MDTRPRRKRLDNPRKNANFFSIITFGFTIETFSLGFSRDLTEDDLYEVLPEHQSNALGNQIQQMWENEVQACKLHCNRRPSLWVVLIKMFGTELLFYGLCLASMEFLIRLQQPLFLGLLLRYYNRDLTSDPTGNYTSTVTYIGRLFDYYERNAVPVTKNEAVFFAVGIIFCSAVNIFVQHPFMMGAMHIGMKMRVATCSLIYRKALKISSQAMVEANAGQVVNLMANDVNRFDTGPLFLHYLWIGPIELILITSLLYREVGLPAVYGALFIVFAIPMQVYLGTLTAAYRRGTAAKTDERVKLMNEIIMGIEVIKMYAWEVPFQKIIDITRRSEIHFIKRTSYIKGTIMSFIMFTTRLGIFVTALSIVFYGQRLTIEEIYFITCYYNILKQTMTLYFPQGIGQVAELVVAIQRIREYLVSEEILVRYKHQKAHKKPEKAEAEKKVKLITITTESSRAPRLSRYRKANKPILKTSQFYVSSTSSEESVATGSLVPTVEAEEDAVIFEHASCKWLRSSTRNDLDDVTFKVPNGALTIFMGAVGAGKSSVLYTMLGELPCIRGSVQVFGTVSYVSQEPWLFAGSVRQNILFGEEFNKKRYVETCNVCALERDISLFPHGDKTIVGERGVSLSGGQRARINLARAIYRKVDIYILDDPLSAVDTHVAKHIFQQCIKTHLKDKTVVLVTHQLQFLKFADHLVIMDNGKILGEGTFQELSKQGLDIIKLMEERFSKVIDTEAISARPLINLRGQSANSIFSNLAKRWSNILDAHRSFTELTDREFQAIGRVGKAVYTKYFKAGANCCLILLVLGLFLLAQVFASAGDYWISRWGTIEDRMTGDAVMDNQLWQDQGTSRYLYIGVFALITMLTILVAVTRGFVFFAVCMRSSINLHNRMFEAISRSPMSFFHSNSSGRILNRFSKDLGSVDELLPQSMLDCSQIILNLLGVTLVILMVNLSLLVPVSAAFIIFYILRVIYLRTSGAVKRLEGITRSPVFSHLNATILGLATIRSFDAEDILILEFDRHQDLHSSAWYLFISCSRGFGFFLDIVCLLFIICVTCSALLQTDAVSSDVGLAITQSISLTGIFQWGMRQSAEMENYMTSAERVLEYTKLLQEAALESFPDLEPPKGWPSKGQIKFRKLSLRYHPDSNNILHNIDLTIEPMEKVGIVGRTGAGKSSVIQALFRLAYTEGFLFIDGIDIHQIGLHDLRSKISIIPQEPVLFSGTLRKNLDPFNEYPDDILLRALKHVKLTTDDTDVGVLDKAVAECGTNFSVGQRQLVCLARAVIRNHRILIMDEATANVDAQTDALIQTTIREHFARCTVLTIAHRLNTVMDSDKIMVLDAGYLVEFGHPHILLQNQGGFFYSMVQESGPAMAATLREIAKTNYEQKYPHANEEINPKDFQF